METLEDVRDRCAYIDEVAGDSPARALEIALESLPMATHISPCAKSEMLSSVGMTRSKLGEYGAAAEIFSQALDACRCDECFPRIRRRESKLSWWLGDYNSALERIDEAILGFAYLADLQWIARSLILRSYVLFSAGNLDAAIACAWRAYGAIRVRDAGHYLSALNLLAYLLTAAGEWREAFQLLDKAEGSLRSLSGYTVLKRCIRWVRALAEAETGDMGKACKLLGQILDEMLGRRLPVRRDQTDAERERALKAARAAPLDVAAVLADYAAAGGEPERIAAAAAEVLALNPEGEHIRARLVELRDAAMSRVDVIPTARAVRAECKTAPPQPPSLAAA